MVQALYRARSRERNSTIASGGVAEDHVLSGNALGALDRPGRELEGGDSEVARTIHPHLAVAETVKQATRATDGWLIHG